MSINLGDQNWEYIALANLAVAQVDLGEYAAAIDRLPSIIDFFDQVQDHSMRTDAIQTLAQAHRSQGNYREAKRLIDQALATAPAAAGRQESGDVGAQQHR